MNIVYRFLRARVFGIDDRSELEKAKHRGLRIGKNSQVMPGCILDPRSGFISCCK